MKLPREILQPLNIKKKRKFPTFFSFPSPMDLLLTIDTRQFHQE